MSGNNPTNAGYYYQDQYGQMHYYAYQPTTQPTQSYPQQYHPSINQTQHPNTVRSQQGAQIARELERRKQRNWL
ncbi:uncharacterized protein VTP21DRAFT_10548 [Calcarisporiella thermophila]|uniref:uncharacterized protein n=1 Tax=Calcarisporiella thermophila TaxID=911321 RepID=UPI003741F876